MIRQWREARGISQLRLSLQAGVSARHLSFIESGRSEPGRDVLIRLGRALGLPLREHNQLLEHGGYAPLHPPRRLDDPMLAIVKEVFRFLLDRHEPNSAVVVDSCWNVVLRNRAHVASMRLFAPDSRSAAGEPANLIEEVFDPTGLRPAIENFDLVANLLHDRLERTAAARPTRVELRALLDRVEAFGPLPPRPDTDGIERFALLLPLVFRRGDVRLSVVSTTTTFTAPLDATVQELQLETFFPTDEESERLLRDLADPGRC
jgi:transcriptional regulator with XRE-family HTH domain